MKAVLRRWKGLWRHGAATANKLAVNKHLVGTDRWSEKKCSRLVAGRHAQGKAIPAKASHTRIALLGPWLPALQHLPTRIVESGGRPGKTSGGGWRVAGMEAPVSVQRNHRLAPRVEVKRLSPCRTCV